jgi:hypothetical protein
MDGEWIWIRCRGIRHQGIRHQAIRHQAIRHRVYPTVIAMYAGKT